jgi:hypothetical protein
VAIQVIFNKFCHLFPMDGILNELSAVYHPFPRAFRIRTSATKTVFPVNVKAQGWSFGRCR